MVVVKYCNIVISMKGMTDDKVPNIVSELYYILGLRCDEKTKG